MALSQPSLRIGHAPCGNASNRHRIEQFMALPINITDLLNKQKIESNRIEFKKGWNPESIYHSICAFANDFDDIGGGYIFVGVDADKETGMAIRPVEGVPIEKIDGILQEMVGYNNKFAPYYLPRTSVEDVDGKQVLVIWCPAGINRPYSIPENVIAKRSKEYFYIRSGTSSIIAKGDVLDELRELAVRVPFDERGNPDIKLEDISTEDIAIVTPLRKLVNKIRNAFANLRIPENERPLADTVESLQGQDVRLIILSLAVTGTDYYKVKAFPLNSNCLNMTISRVKKEAIIHKSKFINL